MATATDPQTPEDAEIKTFMKRIDSFIETTAYSEPATENIYDGFGHRPKNKSGKCRSPKIYGTCKHFKRMKHSEPGTEQGLQWLWRRPTKQIQKIQTSKHL